MKAGSGENIKTDQQASRTAVKRRDLILLLALLAAAGLLFLTFRLTRQSDGSLVEVRVNGELHSAYRLDEPCVFQVRTESGTNVFQIEDGAVYVLEADCPGQDCVRQGKISRRGEMIVCLPHRVVAEITAGNSAEDAGKPDESVVEDGFDTVAK